MRKIAFFLLLLCMSFLSPLSVNAKSEEDYQKEIRSLKDRNTQLENKLEAVTTDLERSTASVKELKKQLAEMSSASKDNAKEVKETREAMKQVKDQLKTLLEQQQSAASTKGTDEQLAKALQRVQQLEKDLKKAGSEIADQKKTIEGLKKTQPTGGADDLKQELENVQVELQKQQKQFKATLELLQDKDAALKEAQATIQTLKTQVSEGMQKPAEKTEPGVAELETMLADVNAKLIKMAQEKSALESQLKGQQSTGQDQAKDAEITKLEGELRKAADYINARDAEIAALTKTKTDLESQLTALTTAKTDAESRLAAMATAKTDVESRLAVITTAKADLESKLAALTMTKSNLESRLTDSSTSMKNQTQETEQLKNTIATLQASLDASERKNAQLTKSALESELKGQQSTGQDQAKDAEITRLEGELRKAADYINARDAEITALTKTKTDLESQLTALTIAKTNLESRLADSSNTTKNQTQEVEQLKNNIATVQASLDASERKNAQLTKDVADLQAELKQTGSVPDEAKKRIQELTQELQDVKMQVDTQQRMQIEYPKLEQEASAYREQVAELMKDQERCQSLQTQLQEAQLALEQSRKELSFAVGQSRKELSFALEQSRKELSFAVEQSRKELDAVTTQNLELKNKLQSEIALRQSQEQKFQSTFARNAELEQKYTEGMKEVQLKEQLLQKVLTEKSLLEKKFDEQRSPYKTLQAQLEQAETKNVILQEQLATLRKTQTPMTLTPQQTTSAQTALQQQLLQEQTLRKQTEAALIETNKQVQTLQQQVAALSAQSKNRQELVSLTQSLPAAAGYEGLSGSMRALFPREISQSVSGGTITMLGWSADSTKIAYQESSPQIERLWIFNTKTKQPRKLTEWQSPSSSVMSVSRFAWASDNEHFLFATGSPGKYGLYLGNSGGLIGSPVPLSENDVCFAWSPTQLQFAYFSGANLIIQDVKGKSLPLQLGRKPDAGRTSLQWSPDGAMLAFSMKRDASFDVFTLKFSEGQPVLQTLVASPSDDIQPSWSPDGKNVAFYVRAEKYDTKLAVTPVDRSRPPYIVAHNTSLPLFGAPQWLTTTEILYVGEEYQTVSQNSIYTVDIATGRRSSAPMSVLLTN